MTKVYCQRQGKKKKKATFNYEYKLLSTWWSCLNHKISDKKAENELFIGIEEQDVVQSLCESKPLLFMHIHPYILVSTAEDTHCLQVEMQVAELINTGSVNLSLRAGTDFMNEKVAVPLAKTETNKQRIPWYFLN